MSEPGAGVRQRAAIRRLSRDDLPRVLEIEYAAFSTPWHLATFEGLLTRTDTDLFAAAWGNRLIGYAICWTVADQAELGNVAVAAEARGTGTGRLLVQTALERVWQRGAVDCFLEVRESNRVARELYEKCGFAIIGRRPRYYSHPLEDALVMRARRPAARPPETAV